MEIKIEVTEKEIAERKREWLDNQFSQYLGADYWKRQATEDVLLSELRKKHGMGSDMYLTAEFKSDLQKTLYEQVKKLVDDELNRQKQSITQIVKNHIYNKFEGIAAQLLRDIIIALPEDFNPDQQQDY